MSEDLHIFYEGQDDLIDILSVSMISICNSSDSFIHFYILDCGIININKDILVTLTKKYKNCTIKFIPVDLEQFRGLHPWPPDSDFLDCYARIIIPMVVSDISYAIYLDSDIIALSDITSLWNEDIEEYDFAACADIGYSNFYKSNCMALGVDPEHIYANAGVLLINCKQWREKRISEKLLQIARDKCNQILIPIEDILSIYSTKNNYKLLPQRYNIVDRSNDIGTIFPDIFSDAYIKNEWKHVVLQHLSPGKAWKILHNQYNGNDLKFFNIFWYYAKMSPFYEGLQNKYIAKVIDDAMNSFPKLVYKKFKGKIKKAFRLGRNI